MMVLKTVYSHFIFLLLVLSVLAMAGCTVIRPVDLDRSLSAPHQAFSHDFFDRVVGSYVDGNGMVDYPALLAKPKDLEQYYSLLSIYSPDSHPELFPSEEHKLAYWINAYNAGVLKTVLTYYPIESVLDVKTPFLFSFLTKKAGFFLFQRVTFGGKTTSLYQLENGVVRKRFRDPRIHFALNCASLGCPRLPQMAFTAESLDQQLDHETRRFLAEKRNYRIDHGSRTISLSMIFNWYEDDFTSWLHGKFPDRPADLLSYIQRYLTPEKIEELNRVRAGYDVIFTPYDWHLNDQK